MARVARCPLRGCRYAPDDYEERCDSSHGFVAYELPSRDVHFVLLDESSGNSYRAFRHSLNPTPSELCQVWPRRGCDEPGPCPLLRPIRCARKEHTDTRTCK